MTEPVGLDSASEQSLEQTIRNTANSAKKVQTDEMIIEEQSVSDLIKADKYLESKYARQNAGVKRFHISSFTSGRAE